MTSQLPRITVVTPSFNQARFLERTIRSVLEQDYPDLEFMIFDGGSTDGSVGIIERYADQLSYWQSRPDGGQSAAVNAGWQRATGEVLAWLNSDDYYLPGALRFVGEYFNDHADTRLIYGTCERVDQHGAYIGHVGSRFRMRDLVYSRQIIPQPSAFMRASLIDEIGLLNPDLNYSMDYDLFLRACRVTKPVFVQRSLAVATIHPDAKTTAGRVPARKETHLLRLMHSSRLGRAYVRLQPILSRSYHALPGPVRSAVRRLRPRRVFDLRNTSGTGRSPARPPSTKP